MPYPICSVVAVFKMLNRILNTLRSRIWDMVLFLFSVFWQDKGGEVRSLLLARKMYRPDDYFLSLTSRKEKGLIISETLKKSAEWREYRKCNVGASKNAGRHTFWVAVDF